MTDVEKPMPQAALPSHPTKAEWKTPTIEKLGKDLNDVGGLPFGPFADGLGGGDFVDAGLS